MDIGLNNTNTLHLALDNDSLKDVEWIVEATSEERFNLWKEYHEEKEYRWEEISMGYMFNIINIECNVPSFPKAIKEILPVTLDVSFAIINGHKILFYDSPSRLSHQGYIDAFLTTYFQRTHDKYTRLNHTNATNFHNCINYLNTIDTEPRNTKYYPSSYEKKYYVFKPVKIKGEKKKKTLSSK